MHSGGDPRANGSKKPSNVVHLPLRRASKRADCDFELPPEIEPKLTWEHWVIGLVFAGTVVLAVLALIA